MIRRVISLLIVGPVVLFLVLLMGPGPRVFEAYLPASVVAALERGVTAMKGTRSEAAGGTAPEDFLVDAEEGLMAKGPIAALPGNRPVFIEAVIDRYAQSPTSDIPAEITTIRPITGCRLTPPMPGTLVGHATARGAGPALGLATYNDAALALGVERFVDAYRETGSVPLSEATAGTYEAYDVAVTETGAPVYLVLETGGGYRMWNIHLAEGARVERVVLLGAEQAGIANLDPVVPVEILPAAGLAACGILPAYPLNPGHRLLQQLKKETATGATGAAESLAANDLAAAAYNTWFRDSFGVMADETQAGFVGGTISVVGPVPDQAEPKAVFAPIQGARIRMTHDKYLEIAGQVPEAETFAGRVVAIATTFAFGDLSYLRQGVGF
ncbi:MAG: hypothetical protein MUE83_13105 [Tabrizicola sp.]|jgi:hypothetical protein|nr:hypothetical protein [Tabrizicola sp.]